MSLQRLVPAFEGHAVPVHALYCQKEDGPGPSTKARRRKNGAALARIYEGQAERHRRTQQELIVHHKEAVKKYIDGRETNVP